MTPWRRRRERRLLALEEYRAARRLVTEEVTALGEQLADLHVETLTDQLDDAARDDYRRALAAYERATTMLREAERAEDVEAVLAVVAPVEDGRWSRACVLARVAGTDLPTRRDPCFFDPRHLPAVADVAWRPPGGVPRDVAVCPECRNRLAEGEAPRARVVRLGDRRVPWWETGDSLPERVRHHAHVVRGDAWHTDLSMVEAEARAAASRGMRGNL